MTFKNMVRRKVNSFGSDERLVQRSQQGGTMAFEELSARHRDKIYARALSMMRNNDEAVALSQKAWVSGRQRLERFRGESSFVAWMTRTVINVCLDELRKQRNLPNRKGPLEV